MKKYIMEIMHEQNDLPSGKYKTVVTVDEAGDPIPKEEKSK